MYSHKLHYKHWCRKALLASLIAILLSNLILPGNAAAWKITTHVYLADIVLEDALDDGHVTIYRVDYESGEIIGEIGEYAVDPRILAALQSNAAQYRAGTIGPDAYPDIVTGQQAIHPDPDLTSIDGGTDAWLKYLWEQSNNEDYKNNNAVRAFTVGFLTHAAGDMYAHTFVNNFTGEAFTFSPIENAIKHVLLEDYIDKRLPKTVLDTEFFDQNKMNIRGVEDDNNDFIYRTMIDARPGTILDTKLLIEGSDGTTYSIPRIFSTLRADLQKDIEGTDCEFWEIKCIAKDEYKKAWRDDIDEGLRYWPQTSHQIMVKLIFNQGRKAKMSEAVDVAEKYVLDHLLSMAGLPDFVGLTLKEIEEIIDKITPYTIKAIINEFKAKLLDKLLVEAIGMTKEQLVEFVTSPNVWFDVAMDSGPGENVTLERFNVEYLRITDTSYSNPDEAFDYKKFPPAYNTVTIGKLTLLSKDGINQLLRDLGSNIRLDEPNIMLGFASTLDGDNQWLNGMVLAQDRQVYEQIFMHQAGERLFVPQNLAAVTSSDGASSPYLVYLPLVFGPETCFGRVSTIVGTDRDETITGTPGDDVILSKGGNDIISGGEGNDIICGGTGDDTISGNQGRDIINGNTGTDTINGGQDNDVLHGGQDNDVIYGRLGNDKIYGGLGDDQIDGNEGYNLIFAGDGFDTCAANIGNFECEN